MKRLAVIMTHPIQYYAPLFRLMTERNRVGLRVFYTKPKETTAFDQAFGRKVSWDIPLLEGYAHDFLPTNSKENTKNLIDSIEQYDPQAILVFGWNPPGHLALMRHFKSKIPVWFRGDSTLLDEQPGFRKMARRLFLKWVYSFVDKAFFVGSQNYEYFRKHGLGASQLIWAAHAIDNKRFMDATGNNEQEAASWRVTLGIPEDHFVVLFAGKLESKKAPELLWEAVTRLNEERTIPVQLIFAGSGVLEEPLKEKAQNQPFVHFIGFQNQSKMPVVYRLGDVVALPSRGPGETWGLAVNEALASGRPVLTSDKVGCHPDLVISGKTGEVFPSGDVAALARTIVFMKENSNKFYSATDLREVIGEWSFEAQVAAYEKEI